MSRPQTDIYIDVNVYYIDIDMTEASMINPSSAEGGTPGSRRARWRRSAWYHLLAAVEARAGARGLKLEVLVGAPSDDIHRWFDADDPMPLAAQWRLAAVAEALFASDPMTMRYARTLRGQLEATAAYLARGPVRVLATVEEARGKHA